MADDLFEIVEQKLAQNTSPNEIRQELLDQGYLEEDIDEALESLVGGERGRTSRLIRIFTGKEVLDRVGYGFVPNQFINILFYLTGANYFWLGVVNGARAILSIIVSSIVQEYSKLKKLGKSFISKSGYMFGFSFLGMAFATLIRSEIMFAAFLLIGGVGVVTHGDVYDAFVKRRLKKEKMNKFLSKIGQYGLLITAVCLLISGWLMDKFPMVGRETVTIFGSTYPLFGYLISFEITAIAFILSGYALSHVKEETEKEEVENFLSKYWEKIKIYLDTFLHNKYIFLLVITSIIIGFTQILGNSYFGVFIYEQFQNVGFGGFMNVAVIYFFAIIASFLGPWFSKAVKKHIGLAPTLVFGTLLSSLMPLALAYNPNLYAIGAANALSVIGASILGVSQGLLARKLLRDDEREVYFSTVSIAGVVPFLFMIPLGAGYAQMQGLVPLFKVLAFTLIIVVAPLYMVLVGMGRDKKL